MTEEWAASRSTAFYYGTQGIQGPGMHKVVASFPNSMDEVTFTCTRCRHAVTLRHGDDPIPFGDPRLCEHMGRHPYRPEAKP